MFILFVLLFMALFTVALAHRYEWFDTRISNILITSLIRVAKKFHIHVQVANFATLVDERALMLLLLLGGDMSLNSGSVTLDVLNARSIRYKGPRLTNTVTSNDLDCLCLTETHVCSSDSDCFFLLITYFIKASSSGTYDGVSFFHQILLQII